MNGREKKRIWAFFSRHFTVTLLGVVFCGGAVFLGCRSSAQAAGTVADQGPDPADANMAPPSGNNEDQAARQPGAPTTPQQQQAPQNSGMQNESVQRAQEYQQTGAQQGAPPPDQQQDQTQAYDNQQQPQGNYESQDNPDQDEANYEELEAYQPPPALPEYDQPPAPDPDYIWTPGYWAYAPVGYYWVPGIWVAAPWPGALWTPGYWGFYGGRYRFHHGYWGRYIGFYGGINYGWGYPGYGFYGGYWRGNHFFYNRNVTRINVTRITNVYSRPMVINRTYINNTRISYNGGRGVQVQPRPAEIAARREPRLAPMTTQMHVRQQAEQNRQQFYNANRGRPATFAAAQPVQADRDVQRPVARPVMAQPQAHTGQPRPMTQQVRPGQPAQPQVRPGQPQVQPTRPEVRPAEPGRPSVQPARPEPNVRPTQPQVRPVQPQTRVPSGRAECAPGPAHSSLRGAEAEFAASTAAGSSGSDGAPTALLPAGSETYATASTTSDATASTASDAATSAQAYAGVQAGSATNASFCSPTAWRRLPGRRWSWRWSRRKINEEKELQRLQLLSFLEALSLQA
jgi:hypothetical protein